MELKLCKEYDWLYSDDAFEIYKDCMYKPKYEKYLTFMKQSVSNPAFKIYVCMLNKEKVGIIVLRTVNDNGAEIEGISVSDNYRCQGIGKFMINRTMETEHLKYIIAQTDCSAVKFYKKCGFSVNKTVKKYPNGSVVRYDCHLSKNAL